MIKVCLADNYPVIHFGVKAYFKDNSDISIVSNVGNFNLLKDVLKSNEIDVLVVDLDLNGMASIVDLKAILREYPNTKILIFSNYSEKMYAPNAIKIGISGYLHKSAKLETLGQSIIRVHAGEIILTDEIKKSIALISKQNKSERAFRKISTREIEVLRHLIDGKKNKEVAAALNLNEKTISTYKLRLLTKLNVTNLVDLVNKAKTLEII
jgi:two-component system, NarL family, response regulator, fimbrial Z protein, FimZ